MKERVLYRQTDKVLVTMTRSADMVSRKRHPVSRFLWPDHDTFAYFARRSAFRWEPSLRAASDCQWLTMFESFVWLYRSADASAEPELCLTV